MNPTAEMSVHQRPSLDSDSSSSAKRSRPADLSLSSYSPQLVYVPPSPDYPGDSPGCYKDGYTTTSSTRMTARTGQTKVMGDPRSPHSPLAGCSLCTIISKAREPIQSGSSSYSTSGSRTEQPSAGMGSEEYVTVKEKKVVYLDKDITAWVAPQSTGEALASDGRHLVIAFNAHLESVYNLGPADIPLLSKTLKTAHSLLDEIDPSFSLRTDRSPIISPVSDNMEGQSMKPSGQGIPVRMERRIGFVVGTIRDPKHSYAHVHLHAVLGKWDRASWYKKTVVYNFMGWYELEDLVAEIREDSSNNRVKSGYGYDRSNAPISQVPMAAARINPIESRTGTDSAMSPRIRKETDASLLRTPFSDSPVSPSSPKSPNLLSPMSVRAQGKQRESTLPPSLPDGEEDGMDLNEAKDQVIRNIDELMQTIKLNQTQSERAQEREQNVEDGDRRAKDGLV